MFSAIGSFFSMLMTPLYYAVSGILVAWHWAITAAFPWFSDGWDWALAIIGLTMTIRALLIPLFVRQITSSRNMQLVQPQLQELREKYKHDRERLAREQMELFKETGTNPFSSCLPLLVQMPIFFALFHVIRQASQGKSGWFLSPDNAASLQHATFLGGQLADSFMHSDHIETKVVAIIMVVVMSITQFVTQRQLMTKNMTPEAMSGPYAQQQKILLYVFPLIFAVSGVAFPIGVLLYWVTSNVWTMAQQFWVIRSNPAPGTPAFAAKQERDRKKGRTVQEDPIEARKREREAAAEAAAQKRTQPKKQPRSQRKGGNAPKRVPGASAKKKPDTPGGGSN